MNTKTILLLLCAAAIPVGGYAIYKHAENNFGLSIGNAQITDISDGTVNVVLQFFVQNTTGFDFTILNNTYNIYCNGLILGVAVQNNPVVVPNRTQTPVFANMVLDKSQIESSLVSALWGKLFGGSGIQLQLLGQCKVSLNTPVLSMFTVTVPVNETFSL